MDKPASPFTPRRVILALLLGGLLVLAYSVLQQIGHLIEQRTGEVLE